MNKSLRERSTEIQNKTFTSSFVLKSITETRNNNSLDTRNDEKDNENTDDAASTI